MLRTLSLLALLAGCTSFETIERGVCGNGLLDPGEDCDSSADTCVRCAVTCSATSPCPNPDYHCGVDAVCHAPAGRLGVREDLGAFQANQLEVRDFDGDSINDAIGVTSTSIVVAAGAESRALTTKTSTITPTTSGPAAFGDLDDDGHVELAFPTPDGIVSMSTRYGALSPVPVRGNPDVLRLTGIPPRVTIVAAYPMTVFGIAVIGIDGSSVNLYASDYALAATRAGYRAPSTPLCGAREADLELAGVTTYSATSEPTIDTDLVVAARLAGGRLCVIAVRKGRFTDGDFLTVTPTPASFVAPGRPVLANLVVGAGDNCPDLLLGTVGDARIWRGGKRTGGTGRPDHCAFDAAPLAGAALEPVPGLPGSRFVGAIRLTPAVAGWAVDALVTSDGVVASAPAETPRPMQTAQDAHYPRLFLSLRNITGVRTGDFDADGDLDAVLWSSTSDDLDVLSRDSAMFAGPDQGQGFQVRRIDTAGVPDVVVAGDFDGNRRPDIAYTEQRGDHVTLSIAYSTPDGPLPPREMASLSGARSLVVASLGDSVDLLGLADDLVVVEPFDDSTRLSFLHGSPQRTLVDYYNPRPSDDDSLLRGAILGRFTSELTPTLAAITSSGRSRLFVVPYEAGALVPPASPAGAPLAAVFECEYGPTSPLCLESARYLPWRLPSGRDVALGVDGATPRPHVVRLAAAAGTVSISNLDPLVALIPDGSALAPLVRGDFDGDGRADLVAVASLSSAAAPGSASGSAVIHCQVDDAGMATTCEDLTSVLRAIDPAIVSCSAGAAGQLKSAGLSTVTTAGDTLVVACASTVGTITAWRLFGLSRGGGSWAAASLGTSLARPVLMQLADVTGDGVPDLAVVTDQGGVRQLELFPQCTSRDLTCGTATEGGQ